ncbi:GNAT family N-acetyltransferase [uncultured Shewanella sp.]|uniref:GNAT family N-acetyltransferase n=1 Tax=uncultured Shewanella sp. TaxID=173975 RepID=UPI00261B22B6|nr:GNAT family N-acetyltransferase [uncultured Shewanella sp.]
MYTPLIDKKQAKEIDLIPAEPTMAKKVLPLMTDVICQRLAIKPIETVKDMACFIQGTYSLQKWRFFILNRSLGIVGGISFGLVGEEKESITALLSYWIGKEYQGQGFATQALSHLMAALKKQQVNHFLAQVYPDNLASQKVLMKLGFTCSDPNIQREDYSGLVDFTLSMI